MNKNIKIFINWFLGPVILVWLGFHLYRVIVVQPGREQAWQQIKVAFTGAGSWQVYLSVILVGANWGIEALKWRYMIKPVQQLTFFQAFKGILAGTSLAVNTPNQVGEYFGRMIYVEEGNRLRTIPLTIACSFSQLIVTLVAGCIGLAFFILLLQHPGHTGLSDLWAKTLLSIVSVGTALAILVYFKLSLLTRLAERIPIISRYRYFLSAMETLSTKTLVTTLGFSVARYVVFILQYLLVMNAFGLNGGILVNTCLVSVLFIVMSAIPTIVLAEAGIRGKAGIFIFGVVYTGNSLAIVSSGLFIWLINLMLPALAGGLMLLGKRIFKK